MVKRDQAIFNIFKLYHFNTFNYTVYIPDEIILLIIKLSYTYHFLCNNELQSAVNQYPGNINIFGNCKFWNVSMITNMNSLFYDSKFNGDISMWDVSNVTNMHAMFSYSFFNGDISNWDVSKITDMNNMFSNSKFDGDISNWDVSNVTDMRNMFLSSSFNGDISNWDVYVFYVGC